MNRIIQIHTYGTSIYAVIEVNGFVEEISCFLTDYGERYQTSQDGNEEKRNEIIDAFNKLY